MTVILAAVNNLVSLESVAHACKSILCYTSYSIVQN